MKLLFKQRLFSWFDSYDIYDEAGNTVYVVKGQLSWGHKLVIYDAYGNEVGMVVQKVLTFLPKFEIYKNGSYIGCLSKEFSFLTPHYNIDYNGWHIDGTIMEWDYSILDRSGYSIARVNKELFHMTDIYVIDVQDPGNALDALMFVLAVCWSSNLEFTVERSTKTLVGSAVSGEGLVNVYRGTGRVLMCPVAPTTSLFESTNTMAAKAAAKSSNTFGK